MFCQGLFFAASSFVLVYTSRKIIYNILRLSAVCHCKSKIIQALFLKCILSHLFVIISEHFKLGPERMAKRTAWRILEFTSCQHELSVHKECLLWVSLFLYKSFIISFGIILCSISWTVCTQTLATCCTGLGSRCHYLKNTQPGYSA